MKYVSVTLSLHDVKLLQSVIRKEARLLGYGSTYKYEAKLSWPSRLRKLNTVARKIGRARDQLEGWELE